MRVDLWNGEARGELKVGNDDIQWRSFTHASDLVSVIEYSEQSFVSSGAPSLRQPKIEFQHLPANPARLEYQNQPIPENERAPEPIYGETNGIFNQTVHWCLQPLNDGGAYVVVWEQNVLKNNHRLLFFTVGFSHSAKGTSRLITDTIAQLHTSIEKNYEDRFVASHRAWWHAYYSESFLSIPDTRMESFYWIQMYKLASATRADRWLRSVARGHGVILMFHHVRPWRSREFAPNRLLEITPGFLDLVLTELRHATAIVKAMADDRKLTDDDVNGILLGMAERRAVG